MKNFFSLILAALILVAFMGCSATGGGDNSTQDSENVEKKAKKPAIIGTPAEGSKFSKIEIGMSQMQVRDIIGQWTDYDSFTTGKAWIPFYFGKDTVRTKHFYKNEGYLIFGGNQRLVQIFVDTTEDGYK